MTWPSLSVLLLINNKREVPMQLMLHDLLLPEAVNMKLHTFVSLAVMFHVSKSPS